MTQILIATKGRATTQDVEILTEAEIKKCTSMADAIRACVAKDPQLSNGTIARFLSKYHTKDVRPQWVYNVRNQELKRK